MKWIGRINEQINIRRNARFFSIPFTRRKHFSIPETIKGQSYSILDEEEAKTDLLYIFIEDIYGLRKTKAELRTIVDVGGNIGLFGMAAALTHPEATVHSYDPQPEVWEPLEKNALQFGFTAHPKAVGGESGKVSLQVGEGTVNTRTKPSSEGEFAMISLLDAVKQLGGSVDLIKLDCEGAEWDIMEDKDAWTKIHRVGMEYHLFDGQTHDQCRRKIEGLGFEVVEHYSETGGNFGLLRAYRKDAVAGW